MAYANCASDYDTMHEIKRMAQRFEEFANKYITQYNPTPKEIRVADEIIANFENNPAPLPLCSNIIDSMIGNYDIDYYKGESSVRAKVVDALVISKIEGCRALFVFKTNRLKRLHWYVVKSSEEMHRAINSGYILHSIVPFLLIVSLLL